MSPFLGGGIVFSAVLSEHEMARNLEDPKPGKGNHSHGTGKLAQILRVLFHKTTELN